MTRRRRTDEAAAGDAPQTSPTSRRLTPEEQSAFIAWLAAEYSEPLIRKWFKERGWQPPAGSLFDYYRRQLAPEIEAARKERRESALNRGLALKEERIRRLAEHADELEAIKWARDKSGRMPNEKAWRETLNDLAAEMGHRRPGAEEASAGIAEMILADLQKKLDPEVYQLVFRALNEGRAEPGAAPEGPRES